MERTSENADHTVDRDFVAGCICLGAVGIG
jgi:hypothetical protein